MKRRIIVLSAVLLTVIVAFTVFFSFTSVANTLSESGGTVSLSFDKKDVKSTDKTVIEKGEKIITLTEGELFKALKSEPRVAGRTDLNINYPADPVTLKFYVGDRLVRDMKMGGEGYEQWVKVYEGKGKHILLLSRDNSGLVELSDEVYSKLSGVLQDVVALKDRLEYVKISFKEKIFRGYFYG